MAWMIGIDEAGYGPNLGPLCVGATVWEVEEAPRKQEYDLATAAVSTSPQTASSVDLYARLAKIVSQVPSNIRLAIADSKQLYKPRGGLRQLERGVLTALSAVGRLPDTWQTLIASHDGAERLPWYANYDAPLPIDADEPEIADLAERFSDACCKAEVRLVDVQTRLVFPREFNELTDSHGTKGASLSHVSIGLLRDVVDRLEKKTPAETQVTCDKHGGRNRYAALLQHHFPEEWIETIDESRAASRYQWGSPESRVEVCFRTKGEAELPTALASMVAKYHRELAMQAFNDFWCRQVIELRPTAGYPLDAKRFKAEIADKQRALGIDDCDLWRNR